MTETIKFNEADGRDGFVISEDTQLLNIFPSGATPKIANSTQMKLSDIVDYSWDAPYGFGRLTAIHCSQKYIAYCVKVNGAGAVRVVELESKYRTFIRGNGGVIRDVEFMHHAEKIVLGFINEYGSFYICRLDKTMTVRLLSVVLEGSPSLMECRRFIWCRYVPDARGDSSNPQITSSSRDDPFYQFAIIENDLVHVANVLSVTAKYGEGVHQFTTLRSSFLTTREHTKGILDAAFAPDGTTIATASRDGTVKFFQIYFLSSDSDGEARCLYSWSPHDGEPVSKIYFLNDSKSQDWNFVITAGPNMSELKMWNYLKLECVQTLRFVSSPISFRMDMNFSANFFVLADSERKVLYVLHVEHDENAARFSWITEFSVPVPVLGFNICNAEFCKMRKIVERGFEHFLTSDSDVRVGADVCMVDMLFVQPQSLMEASMAFRPPLEQIGHVANYPSPKAAPSVASRDMSPGVNPLRQATSTSVISMSHLTKQLSSLIGVGMSPNPSSTHANPFMAAIVERPGTSSTNGNMSNSSSCPFTRFPNDILEKIIHHVGQTDALLRCRLVNITMSIFATQALKTRLIIAFNNETNVEQAFSIFKTKLPKLEFPVSRFHINSSSRSVMEHYQLTLSLASFFRRYRLHVQELELDFQILFDKHRPSSSEDHFFLLLANIPMLLGFTPNLERLKLRLGHVLTEDEGLRMGALLPEVLPKLTSIVLIRGTHVNIFRAHDDFDSVHDFATNDGRLHFVTALRNSSPILKKLSLTQFAYTRELAFKDLRDIMTIFKGTPKIEVFDTIRLGITDIRKLQEFDLLSNPVKFATLGFAISHDNDEDEVYKNKIQTAFLKWLEMHSSSTLESLSLSAGSQNSIISQVPALPAFESWNIEFQGNRIDIQLFVAFGTTQQFPQLKHVDVDVTSEYHPGLLGTGVGVFETVESLRITCCEEMIVYPWNKIFPKTKSLELQISTWKREMLLVFMKQMSNIIHFKIDYPNIDNDEPELALALCQILNGSHHSLANFRNLESLDINGRHSLITKTMAEMTLARRLNPLKRLTLMEAEGITEWDKRVLKNYHQDVNWKD